MLMHSVWPDGSSCVAVKDTTIPWKRITRYLLARLTSQDNLHPENLEKKY